MGNMWITTGKAAKKIGIHPNTLRWYEEAGYLPPVPRTPGGYRTFSPWFLQLASIVHRMQPVLRIFGPVRRMGRGILSHCRDQQFEEAQQLRGKLEAFLIRELDLARQALEVLEGWRSGDEAVPGAGRATDPCRMVFIGEAAARTGLSRDRIINWERNGLLEAPRDGNNRYRIYGKEELERMLIIRSCRTAGYSITAIRRLLLAIDEGMEAGREHLEELANTPHPAETALFPTFPTDTLPDTLAGLIAIVKEMDAEIRVLKRF
jgi:DNA-binding transcriptional MerR regulator